MQLTEFTSQLAKLNLPIGQYVIVASGPLAAHGIRESNDLDILVTPELFNQLKKTYQVQIDKGFERLAIDNLEIVGTGSTYLEHPEIATIEEQIQTADIIDGIPYLNLELTKKFKQLMGREKDFKDIELINNYLKL